MNDSKPEEDEPQDREATNERPSRELRRARRKASWRANRARQRRPKKRGNEKVQPSALPRWLAESYLYSAELWQRACAACGVARSVAIRPCDQRCLCAACVERLGVKALGAEPAAVTVRFECPVCGGPHPRDQHV